MGRVCILISVQMLGLQKEKVYGKELILAKGC